MLDKRGTGLSDRVRDVQSLETSMDDIRAVMDAVGSEHATLLGVSEGGPMCSLFAATYPQRTSALVLGNTSASYVSRDDCPGVPREAAEAFAQVFEEGWGTESFARSIGLPSVAGDRRATEGFQIAHRSIEKVFAADDMSAVAIAGAAGPAVEMVRLFQTELEHYEKVEGERLSLEGKANKLGQMIRANLPAAMQGFVVVPLFAGYDAQRETAIRRLHRQLTGKLP